MMSSRGICGTCVMDEVRKAVEIDYGLLELLEFWKYEVTCTNKDTNEGDAFAEYINMFLNCNTNHLATHSEINVTKTRTDTMRTTGALTDLLSVRHPFPKMRRNELWLNKWNSMWSKCAQNDKKTRLRESFTSSGHVRVPRLHTSYSRTKT